MRVLISADWEGIAGIVSWAQEQEESMRCRRLMTAEVNAAVQGALAAGAEQVIVNDSHGSMRNLIIEELHPSVRLISGSLKEFSMMAGIQMDVDAAVFIGYHAKAGTARAILDHTYSGSCVHAWRLNGIPAGETTLNAAIAGYFDVPVVLVSGDDGLRDEAESIGAVHVQVKEAQSRYSACSIHPEASRERIESEVRSVLGRIREFQPLKVSTPVTMELDVVSSAMVEPMLLIPGLERQGPRTASFTDDDYITAYKAMRAAITLANTVRRG